jgi:hypothetical protein
MLYYEDEYVQLHHGDCRAIRGWTTAQVLITDPPYGTQPNSTKIGYGRKVQADGFRGQLIANDTDTGRGTRSSRCGATSLLWYSAHPAFPTLQ